MKSFTRAVVAALLVAAAPATYVIAQGTPGPGGEGQRAASERRGPSPEFRSRMQDGRFAMIKEALKLTPEQAKLFEPVEAKLRANAAERMARHEERRKEWRERRAEGGKGGERGERLGLPDRLDRRSKNMTERAAKLKDMADTIRPFYASLSAEQQEIAQHLLGRGGGKGHRWAGHHGRGGHGWGHHGGGRRGGPGGGEGPAPESR